MQIIQPVKGTRDFYPEDMSIRRYIFGVWRKVAEKFGYQEYDGPYLEPFELFASKSGEELVNNQMYTLIDRGNRKLGIRPEMTPTLARMVAAKRGSLDKILRWYSLPICWRYEKPQKGRVREFAQLNVDFLGSSSKVADAEVISVGVEMLKELGFGPDEVYVRVNNRYLMERKFAEFGIPKEKEGEVFAAIDKKERMDEKEYVSWLADIGLTSFQIDQLNSFLSQKDFGDDKELNELFEALKQFGVSEFVEFDPVIVRGIAYYTGTVFEAFDRKKEFRSIFAGGRYDDLVEVFGGGKFPGVGFGFGDVILERLLRSYKKLPELSPVAASALVTVFSDDLKNYSMQLAVNLRKNGVNTELYLDSDKLDKQFSYAAKKGITYVFVVGPDEAKNNKVTLKNLLTGEQKTDSLDRVLSHMFTLSQERMNKLRTS